ncbi:PepSY domain-containing protein [Ruegeria sp. EL01]|uniref:PepSY domain-containing protein n=1 Tax=Ruegeria sp. EL01 TaxID=2107578 RepID=UPI0013C4815F|nr:PepSY domain-containing protein [Ruegeria sp. EL01]
MNSFGKWATLAAISIPGLATAQINVGDALGSTEESIRSALEAQGYAISDVETEGGEIEVQASLDGKDYEIEVSIETGQIVEIEEENDTDEG